MSDDLKTLIRAEAVDAGFDKIAFVRIAGFEGAGARLDACLANGHHGTMAWMAEKVDRRRHPSALWPDARTVIVLGMNYGPGSDPLADLACADQGNISVYARGRDYHDLVKTRLKRVARALAAKSGADVKVFVDTAPVMEKPLSQAAGIGWQGKHTNLVSREFGSWLFLGEIFTTLDLAGDHAAEDHCGSCRRCLDICPTNAFPEPYKLDARRCISYLTIEYKGHIAPEFRKAMGNRIYGCDDCLAVCPWNRFASTAREGKLQAREELNMPALDYLVGLDGGEFRTFFSGSPIKRTGRDRFVRNCLIAVGNSGDTVLAAKAVALLEDESPLVRAMAIWACGQLLNDDEFAALKHKYQPGEPDAEVANEWPTEKGSP
jgi:epoxyqueuosine reductase